MVSVMLAAVVLAACQSGTVQTGTVQTDSAQGNSAATDAAGGVVLVAGATGGTGQMVVKHLLEQGYDVKALVRSIDKARGLFGDTVEYATGDVRNPDQLIEAMVGVDYVISSVGGSRNDKSNYPEQVDFGGVRNMADVAAASGVKQMVLVSSSGVTQEDHFLNKMFNDVMKWKLKGEDALRASGVPYTIVRPGGLVDKPAGSSTIVFAQGDTTSGAITREDVALICVAALQYPEARGKTFETFAEGTATAPDWASMFGGLNAD